MIFILKNYIMTIEQIIQIISTHYKPKSIFLYGSRWWADFLPKSDYEIWVIFEENNYIHRSVLKQIINDSKFSIYPFKYNDIINYELDTPFQKTIYMSDLIRWWKTIFWDKIIENLHLPKITVLDLIQDLRFNIGYALAAMHSYRNGDKYTASYEFYKSCLFWTRDLIILKTWAFPIWFKQIVEYSKKIDLWEFTDLVNIALNIREQGIECDENSIFRNIKYLNKFIETEMMNEYNKK